MSNDDLPPDSPDEPPPGPEPKITFQDVLDYYAEKAENTKQKGDYFERLIVAFLRTAPYYASFFSKVELIGDSKFAEEHNLTSGVGVDIIATERETGEHWAIQAKFRENVLTVAELATFFLIAGKSCFSRSMIASASEVNEGVIDALAEQTNPCSILGISELAESPINWGDLKKNLDTPPRRHAKKRLRKHQVEAVEAVVEGFKTADRGQMIMACGTGKTFTALKLAERIVPKGGSVLVLTPSISLISQTLHEWYNDKEVVMRGAAVCSDSNVRRSGEGSGEPLQYEVGFPVTTKSASIAYFLKKETQKASPDALSVVYCTYHSLAVIHEAQKVEGVPKFDLIICDEAHRTAGRKYKDKEEASLFARVHDAEYVKAGKRLYMTATTKSYTRAAKSLAEEKNLLLYSMNNEKLYGKEFYCLTFAGALKRGLLSDYKVIVLGIKDIPKEDLFSVRKDGEEYIITGKEEREELTRAVGCFHALSKKKLFEGNVPIKWEDSTPMKRAVAFSNEIKESERFRDHMGAIQEKQEYEHLTVKVKHVDGTMNAQKRNRDITWLKNGTERKKTESDAPICYILTNAKCLSEGVDVPALDAILFLKRRKAQIDVIQSVGRVMRLAEGKKMGYVIIPITVRDGGSQELALHKNRQYKEVWDVLQALRSHDDAINVEINQMYLPREGEKKEKKKKTNEKTDEKTDTKTIGISDINKKIIIAVADEDVEFALRFQESLQADIVKNCGDRNYFKSWAEDVGKIARAYTTRIGKALSDKESKEYKEFEKFLKSLQRTLNPNISEEDAIEMLAQHLVARPVFDALFKDYAFAKRNPVSQAMQRMINLLANSKMLEKNQKLEEFYEDVKIKVAGIQDTGMRQEVIRDLYETFFKSAFPKLAARVGLVYTPLTVVDFILHSVNDISQREFRRGLADEGVHILDPFTGMGTFITRLMQNELIPDKKDLERKFMGHGAHGEYTGEIHANELVLLAYYIATINIEEVYHSLSGDKSYQSFRGAVLTDTFRLKADTKDSKKTKSNDSVPPTPQPRAEDFFAQMAGSTKVQNKRPIRVIVGNPPYSIGQKSDNDANQNQKYEDHLDKRIRATYAKHTNSTTLRAMYDSCNRAIRWASDRIGTDPGDEGIIGFVTNGYFLDSGSASGLRHCLMQEFSQVHCFNLRGNIRLNGKEEGGNIFGGSSSVSVVILILVKKANDEVKKADPKAQGTLHYHDIGAFLKREEKLGIIAGYGSIANQSIPWEKITPDKYYDWINHRNEILYQFIPLGIKETRGEADTASIFTNYSQGIVSSRDSWVYNFSRDKVEHNMQSMIEAYNQQVQKTKEKPNSKVNNDAKQINWSRSLRSRLVGQKRLPTLDKQRMALSQYRPFAKRHLYYERNCLEVIYQQAKLFPIPEAKNKVICVSGMSARKDFSALMVDSVPDFTIVDAGQCFPLYTWEKGQAENLIHSQLESSQNENITDYAFSLFREAYPGIPITREDIFYYVYGVLHSPEYIERFAKDLKKIFISIPLARTAVYFAQYRDAGRQLGEHHLNYEKAPLCNKVSLKLDDAPEYAKNEANLAYYRVEKMKFAKTRVKRKLVKDTSIIHYNENITLGNIPPEAYNYQINGRPAIEWIMDQYRVQADTAPRSGSGIVNDPNDWAREHNNPRYILDLLLRVITVSLETVKIVDSLPTEDSFGEDKKTLDLIKNSKPPRNGGA